MSKISFTIGIFAFAIFILALIPCLGWMNWISLPLALTGCVLNAITVMKVALMGSNDTSGDIIASVIGFMLCIGVLILGPIRLFFGGGVL